MKAWYAFLALMNLDKNCERYIAKYAAAPAVSTSVPAGTGSISLQTAIEKGLKDDARMVTQSLAETGAPLDIIHTELIPALNRVGDGFEKGTVFLPQLRQKVHSLF